MATPRHTGPVFSGRSDQSNTTRGQNRRSVSNRLGGLRQASCYRQNARRLGPRETAFNPVQANHRAAVVVQRRGFFRPICLTAGRILAAALLASRIACPGISYHRTTRECLHLSLTQKGQTQQQISGYEEALHGTIQGDVYATLDRCASCPKESRSRSYTRSGEPSDSHLTFWGRFFFYGLGKNGR
jgi:hypothetical protein